MLLSKMLERIVRHGSLTLIDAKGKRYLFGDGGEPVVTIRVHDPALHWRIPMNPTLHAGEAYMDGTLTIEEGTLQQFLDITTRDIETLQGSDLIHRVIRVFGKMIRLVQQYNYISRSRRNVAHHYDLSDRLYDLFLDGDRQYSCAYFTRPDESLAEAQHHKKVHIAAKLLLDRPGLRVLDIGSGWGGLALYLAEMCGARVTGVTLSDEQFALARNRADEKGLAGRIEFRLQDYRDIAEQFDRIVSVGMFEHVGVNHFDAYFRKCAELLSDDGVMLLHSIGRSEGPGVTNPWIAKYIFPGGYIPALSEVLPAVERAGLLVTDIEVLRLHYAETLRHWRERFLAHRDDLEKIYDGRFIRMWEFYLAASEMTFREQGMMVFQLQLTRRQGIVPIARDYIAREEARLRGVEGGSRAPLRLAGE